MTLIESSDRVQSACDHTLCGWRSCTYPFHSHAGVSYASAVRIAQERLQEHLTFEHGDDRGGLDR